MQNTRNIGCRRQLLLLVFVIVSGVAFYGLDRWSVKMNDDWHYTYISQPEGETFYSIMDDGYHRQRVSSWSDAFRSQSQEYLKDNGRFLVHATVQYLCGTKTIGQFAVMNTVMFCLFLVFMVYLCIGKSYNLPDLIILLAAVWFLIPFKGLTFMGPIANSVNYLWTAVFTLAFLLVFSKVRSVERRLPFYTLAALFVGSLFVGALQESFSIGLAGALFIYYAFHSKELNANISMMMIGYFIGTATHVLAPANFHRTAVSGGIGLHLHAILGFVWAPVVLLLACILIAGLIFRRSSTIEFIRQNAILLLAVLIGLVFNLFIAYIGRHQFTSGYIFCTILLLRWLRRFSFRPAALWIASGACVVIMALMYVPVLQARQANVAGYNDLIRATANSHDGTVISRPYADIVYWVMSNRWLYLDYIYTMDLMSAGMQGTFYQRSISVEASDGRRNNLFMQFLPDTPANIAKACNRLTHVGDSLYHIFDGYAVVLSASPVRPMILAKRDEKSVLLPPFVSQDQPCSSFAYRGKYYYVFDNLPKIRGAMVMKSGPRKQKGLRPKQKLER